MDDNLAAIPPSVTAPLIASPPELPDLHDLRADLYDLWARQPDSEDPKMRASLQSIREHFATYDLQRANYGGYKRGFETAMQLLFRSHPLPMDDRRNIYDLHIAHMAAAITFDGLAQQAAKLNKRFGDDQNLRQRIAANIETIKDQQRTLRNNQEEAMRRANLAGS